MSPSTNKTSSPSGVRPKVSVVVPAYNEERSVGQIVQNLREWVGPLGDVVVVDNASDDATRATAMAAGASRVIHEYRRGKGFAVLAGATAAREETVLVCDADVRGMALSMLDALVSRQIAAGVPVVRLSIGRGAASAPVTTLVARPLLEMLGVSAGLEPIGGIVLCRREFLMAQHLAGGWGFDIGLTIACIRAGVPVEEIAVNGVEHRVKKLDEYAGMASEVMCGALRAIGLLAWDHVDCTLCVERSRMASHMESSAAGAGGAGHWAASGRDVPPQDMSGGWNRHPGPTAERT